MAEKRPTSSKRTRASKPKVRSGCTTCKIRRVKCDETKPVCQKCTTTGRKCDGYGRQASKNHHLNDAILVVPSSLQVKARGTDPEMRSFEYFRLRTAPALSIFHDSGFWTQVVLQMGHQEPAVMHAAITLSLFHEQYEATGTPVDLINAKSCLHPETNSLALQQYNKAINCLVRRASEDPSSHAFVLITCLLFVCTEFIKGNAAAAISHIQSGLNILSKYQSPLCEEAPSTRKTPHFIGDNLTPMFSRLNILAMLFGTRSSSYFLPSGSSESLCRLVPDTLDSMTMARDSMMNTMNVSLNFVHTQLQVRYDPKVNHEALAEQARLQDQLARWLKAFDSFERNFKFSFQKLEWREALQLRILHKTISVWLSTCMSPEECAFDPYIREFRTIISLASILEPLDTDPCRNGHELPKFSFEMGTITSLYFAAVKCRDPIVRRDALARLVYSHRQEGLFDSPKMAIVAARVIALEEGGIRGGDFSFVPERARIHNADICQPRRQRRTVCVRFMTKPHGVYGNFEFRREQLRPLYEEVDTELPLSELIMRKAVPVDLPLTSIPGGVHNLRCSVSQCAFIGDD